MEFLQKEETLIKDSLETDPSRGCPPDQRKIKDYLSKGVVNIDKPAGPTSHQVTSWVKEIIGLEKSGHSGTLDPKVTGVLPIALDDATKIVKTLLLAGKTYVGVMQLHSDVTENKVKSAMSQLQGTIIQRPPLISAVKRQLRIKTIYDLQLMEKNDKTILFSAKCQAGVYIRKLCHDIGYLSGARGQMTELRRTKVGLFTEENLIKLHDLVDAYKDFQETGEEKELRKIIYPMEYAVGHLPKIWIKDSAIDAVCHGADLSMPGVSKLSPNIDKGDEAAIFSLKDELVAIATCEKTSKVIMDSKTGVAATLKRVTMEPDTYPRKWKKKT
ncbi:MAG: RNA-guided pseudouridylation complex pseudouridine synthase subunit Cbf5 [Candidatus Altiarchaeota archaeon]